MGGRAEYVGSKGLDRARRIGIRATALLVLVAAGAQAQDVAGLIAVKPVRVELINGRGVAIVSVTNGAPMTVDIQVTCTFYKGSEAVSTGTGTVNRLPRARTDSLEVRSQRVVLGLDSATCQASGARP